MEEEFESAYPGFVRPFTIPSPPVYEVVPIKGAGLGVIATSDIARGQTIMRERPLLFLPVIYPVASMGENLAFYEFVVNSMRPVNREAVYALVNARGPEWYSHLKGILDTNAFGTHTAVPGYGAQYAALGRDISRINHSCAPNALWIWDLETLTFTVAAITPIRAGEQVTIAYIDIACPRFQRQELLTSRYKFTCKCPACDPDDMSQLMNDMQREIINLFAENEQPARDAEAFERWLADGARDSYYDPHDTLKPATFARDVERLDGFTRARFAFGCMFTLRFVQANIWEPTLARIVKGYSVRENEERVREYALLAAGLKKAHTGSDGGWMAVAMKPRSTDWWGKLGAAR
ncbi:hypothetical protein C8Q80DRAFT_1111142 [Daedaleopsis nitida]|nr:hypothetical protein C8Q80DRAFT_1111142 [Daedaleopsis nitida]